MQITEHFSKHEFDCHDGSPMPSSVFVNVEKLAQKLEIIRSAIGNKPMSIMSGYRTPSHNASVKGASNSQHLVGKAADLKVKGLTPTQLYLKIEALINQGAIPQGGQALYDTFVHYDIRGTKARWNRTPKKIVNSTEGNNSLAINDVHERPEKNNGWEYLTGATVVLLVAGFFLFKNQTF